MKSLVLVLVVGCGHYQRAGIGPIVDNAGHPGALVSGEVATYGVGSRKVAPAIGLRGELAATTDGAQVLVALAYTVAVPAGGFRARSEDQPTVRGWGGRTAFAFGADVNADGGAMGVRGGVGVTRGSQTYSGHDRGPCLFGGEKSSLCFGSDEYTYAQRGLELGVLLRLDEDADGVYLDSWRVSAEYVVERGTLSD